MATNHVRPTQRLRTLPVRGKGDENATSKHVRQTSNIALAGASRLPQKDVNGAKSTLLRPALGEVTTTAVNRRENVSRVVLGKEKDDVSLKRGRSNSSANAVQRVPLGPGRSQVAPPVTNIAPVRVAPARSNRTSTISFHTAKRVATSELERDILAEVAVVIPEDVDMDIVDDEPAVAFSEGPEPQIDDIARSDFLTSEPDFNDMAVVEDDADDSEDEVTETVTKQPKAPRVWPDLETAHRRKCDRDVRAIREVFEEDEEEYEPTMVSEYAEEIFEYMSGLEESMMPKADYMENQTELTWQMRGMLVDWLLQVHLHYHMLPETLWIAINIVDRFLSNRTVSIVKLQLVGITAMFIAAKYEEILAPSVEEFVFITEQGYTKDEILKGERIILQTLDFKISHYCSPYNWMRRISKADDYDLQTRTLGKFLIEVTLLDHRFLRAKSSLVAAVGMYSARAMLGGDWNDAFVFYSGFSEEQLFEGHRYIVEKLADKSFGKLYLYKKYASKKFLKASTFAVKWSRSQVAGAGDVQNTMLDAELA